MSARPLAGAVPARLARRVEAALRSVEGRDSEPRRQLAAAEACLRESLRRGNDRDAALDLLAADALLTAACGEVAGSGDLTVEALAADAVRRLAPLAGGEDGP